MIVMPGRKLATCELCCDTQRREWKGHTVMQGRVWLHCQSLYYAGVTKHHFEIWKEFPESCQYL